MRTSFFESENSRYLLILRGRELILNREDTEIWRRTIKFTSFEIIGVGNNGRAAIKADEGIVIYPASINEKEIIIDTFEKSAMEAQDSFLAKAKLDGSGDRLCIEKMTFKTTLKEKLFKFLTADSSERKGTVEHELMIYDIKSKRQAIIKRFIIGRNVPNAFYWDISSDFFYLIIGEAQKKGKKIDTKFSMVDLRTDEIFAEFVLEGYTDWILRANNYGSILIDSPEQSESRKVLICNSKGEKFWIEARKEFDVGHLGKSFVALISRMKPLVIFKKHNDEIIHEIDLSPVADMEMEYQVVFTPKDDIDLIAYKEGNIKIVHSTLDRFSVDAKRWEMISNQKKIDEEISRRREILEAKEHDLREQRSKMKVDELMRTALEFKQDRKKEKVKEIEERERKLGELRLQFLSDKISKYDYAKEKERIEKEIESLKTPEIKAILKSQAVAPSDTEFMPEEDEGAASDKDQELSYEPDKLIEPKVVKSKQAEEPAKESLLSAVPAAPVKPQPSRTSIIKPVTKSMRPPFPLSPAFKKDKEAEKPLPPVPKSSPGSSEGEPIIVSINDLVNEPKSSGSKAPLLMDDAESEQLLKQKKKYQKLMFELKESFENGGISKENYQRLSQKYEEKLKKLEEEGI